VGKIIGTGLVSLTQYAIWAAVAMIIMVGGLGGGQEAFSLAEHISWGEVAYMVIFFLLGFLLFGTAYAAIGAMCNTEQEANHLHTPLVMLLVAPVLVAVNVIQDPSGTVARVLSFIPFSAPIVMFMRINVSSVSGVEIGLCILGIVVTIIVMFWIVARIFRVGILMYGKRPSLPELIRWIRYA
jgi:ABC-2 type transport system permease protein